MPTGIGINASCLKDDSRDNEVPLPLSLGRALFSEAIPKSFTVCQIKSVIGFGLLCGSLRRRGRNRAMVDWIKDENPHTGRGIGPEHLTSIDHCPITDRLQNSQR